MVKPWSSKQDISGDYRNERQWYVRSIAVWVIVCAVILIVGCLAPSAVAFAQEKRSIRQLGLGTAWQTPIYLIDSGVDGPTVMVVGGMHGNEPAGAYAADQIRHWRVKRGRLIVVPRANRKALEANVRRTPGVARDRSDLNRNFPVDPSKKNGEQDAKVASSPARGAIAQALWKLAAEEKPDWLLDLHEGFDFHKINDKSVGSSIIRYRTKAVYEVAPLMLNAVNKTVSDAKKQFVLLRSPIAGSLARAVGMNLSANTMILETTFKDQPLSVRARQHRVMVHQLLAHLSMALGRANVMVPASASRGQSKIQRTRIALYDAGGVGGRGVAAIQNLASQVEGFHLARVCPADLLDGALQQFDVVVFPGGSGSKQAAAIGEKGRSRVNTFIRSGGGYVGICAGAYLATSRYSWGLKVVDAYTIDSKHWNRGKAVVDMELTKAGKEIIGSALRASLDDGGKQPGASGQKIEAGRKIRVLYANGPLLGRAELPAIEDFKTLAYFRSEVAKNGAPNGVMINTPAIIAGVLEKGKVICFSPHPEQTKGLDRLVVNALRWAGSNSKTSN